MSPSIQQIAEAPLPTVVTAISDDKAARSLQNACKAHLKRFGTGKRPAPAAGDESASKRAKYSASGYSDDFLLGPAQMTPQQLESSLELPVSTDEEKIAQTAIVTNRAPLVLAFAVELLRYTMPEQPPSSRLSLAQAVVSANSRSKAVSIGLDKGPSADDEGWGEGQPRIRVMGRDIAVLKRGGYQWKGDEVVEETESKADSHLEVLPESTSSTLKGDSSQSTQATITQSTNVWASSQPISLKSSTFIARAAVITDPSQRQSLMRSLFEAHPNLKTANHNAWAYRIRPSQQSSSTFMREDSFDDGESGCGDLMLRIMKESNAVDTIVVLTRWFGGIMLGPDRWRLMRNVVTSALSERLRKTGAEVSIGGEAVWGLDLEGMRNKSATGGHGSGTKARDAVIGGMQIHRPEAARNYILRSFGSPLETHGADNAESPTKSKAPAKKTQKILDAEKAENLGLLLGALRLLFDSWADHLTAGELDRRAWSWYVAIRPEVENGPSGWGAKGQLKLQDILNLRRKPS